MKKIKLILLMFLGVGSYGVSWAGPEATTTSSETFFIKAEAGSFLSQWVYDNYNRTNINGIPPQITSRIGALNGFTGSLALGLDCPDHFSYFLSGEFLPADSSILVNGQYTFSNINTIKPYIFFGLGFDVSTNNSIGGSGELGIGTNITMAKSFDLVVESKFVFANTFWNSANNKTLDFIQWDGYLPVLIGIKFKL